MMVKPSKHKPDGHEPPSPELFEPYPFVWRLLQRKDGSVRFRADRLVFTMKTCGLGANWIARNVVDAGHKWPEVKNNEYWFSEEAARLLLSLIAVGRVEFVREYLDL